MSLTTTLSRCSCRIWKTCHSTEEPCRLRKCLYIPFWTSLPPTQPPSGRSRMLIFSHAGRNHSGGFVLCRSSNVQILCSVSLSTALRTDQTLCYSMLDHWRIYFGIQLSRVFHGHFSSRSSFRFDSLLFGLHCGLSGMSQRIQSTQGSQYPIDIFKSQDQPLTWMC